MFLTDRLLLRPFDAEADINVRTQWMNDPDLLRAMQLDAQKPAMREKVKKFLESAASRELPRFIIAERPPDADLPSKLEPTDDYFMKDGKPRYPQIGVLAFNVLGALSVTNRECFLGIAFAKAYQGKGLGTEVMRWGMDYLFNNLGMHRCTLHTGAKNAQALRAYGKVGFVHEGVMRKTHLRDGEWQDTVVMGMLEDDWRAKNGNKLEWQ